MNVKLLLCVVLAAVLLAGCTSYVAPSDRVVIHDHRLNAAAFDAKVQADPVAPDYVKRWVAAELLTWQALDAWAAQRAATPAAEPTTQPVGGDGL